jgi:hypothetical protein
MLERADSGRDTMRARERPLDRRGTSLCSDLSSSAGIRLSLKPQRGDMRVLTRNSLHNRYAATSPVVIGFLAFSNAVNY